MKNKLTIYSGVLSSPYTHIVYKNNEWIKIYTFKSVCKHILQLLKYNFLFIKQKRLGYMRKHEIEIKDLV